MAKATKTATKAASNEAEKRKGGGHARLSLTGLERMAKEHRKAATEWRDKAKGAGAEFKFAMGLAAQVHERSAKILQGEANELRTHP